MKNQTNNLKIKVRYTAIKSNLKRHKLLVAYIAGLFDGEGNLYKTKEGYWRLCIANTHYPVMEWLVKMIPGTKIYKKQKDYRGINKECYYWTLCKQPAILELLSSLYHYCIIKKSVITTALTDLENTYTQRGTKRLIYED